MRGEGGAADVNEQGVVIGTFAEDEESGAGRAFVWRGGEARRLPGLGGDSEFVRRINEHNQIVGAATDRRGREHPVVWRGGRPHDLGIPAGFEGAYAMGINDRGDIVGAAYSETGQRAWAWSVEGASHPLDRLGNFAQVNVNDNAGRAMGISDFGGNPGAYAALWSGSREVESLGVFGTAGFSFALGTSGKGDVVGVGDYYGFFTGDVGHVFLRRVPDYQVARVASPPPMLTLMPLSGDPRDHSNAHAVLRSDPPLARQGTVTVGGHSATGVGDEIHATLWTCAYQQGFEVGEDLTTPPTPAANRRSRRLPLA